MHLKKEILSFLVIGGTGFLIDATMAHILITELNAGVISGRVPGFIIAILATFVLNSKITFGHIDHGRFLKKFIKYCIANGFTQSTNFLIYSVLMWRFETLHDWPVVAVFCGSAVAATISFILYKKVVFKPNVTNS